MMDSIAIQSGSLVALQSQNNRRYLRREEGERVSAQGCHPFLLQSATEKRRVSFVAVTNPNAQPEPLTLCTQLFLVTPDGMYLSCNPKGEVYLDKQSEDKTVMKFKRWTIVSRLTPTATRQLLMTDDVMVKSAFGGMLRIGANGITASGSVADETASWAVQTAEKLPLPDWLFTRAHQSGGMVINELAGAQSGWKGSHLRARLKFESLREAEEYVLEEAVCALLGAGGQFVVKNVETGQWALEHGEQFEPGFVALVSRALPVAFLQEKIRRFEANFNGPSNGLQLQAVCAGLASIRKDFLLLVHKLEVDLKNKDLDAQKLLLNLTPVQKSLEPLTRLLDTLERRDKPPLTVLMAALQTAPDAETAEVNRFLYAAAAKPLLAQMHKWIHFGVLDDSRKEFFVEERASEDPRSLSKYQLVPDKVPNFLVELAPKILKAGRFAAVMSVYDPKRTPSPVADLLSAAAAEPGSPLITSAVNSAALYVDREVVKVMLAEQRLKEKLESLRRFFLMSSSDYLIHFLDLSESELRKNYKAVSIEKLKNFLELAVRSSSAANDPFREDFSVTLSPLSLIDAFDSILSRAELDPERAPTAREGSDMVTFTYAVNWPLSLVLTPQSLAKYQVVSRYLLMLKFCERQLCSAWVAFQEQRDIFGKVLSIGRWILMKALSLSRGLLQHVLYDVIHPRSEEMLAAVREAGSFDEIVRTHDGFLDALIRESMLADKKFRAQVWTLNMFFYYLGDKFKAFLSSNFTYDFKAMMVSSAGRERRQP